MFVHILMHLLQGLEHFEVDVSVMWVTALRRALSHPHTAASLSDLFVCKQPFYIITWT